MPAARIACTPSLESTGEHRILGYELITSLGAGALGDVKLAADPQTGEVVAIKVVDHAKATERQIEQCDNEVCALRALEGAPHCLQLKAASVCTPMGTHEGTREVYAQVTEFAEFGDLFGLLEAGGAFSEAAAKALFKQLLSGLSAFQERDIAAHRDIKPENLLVGGDGALRLADFNLCAHGNTDDQTPARERRRRAAHHRDDLLRSACGSRSYMAPEVLTAAEEAYRGAPADVWSAAVVLFTALVGHPPFEEASQRCWFHRKCCVEPGKKHLFWAAHARSAPAARAPAEGGVSESARALLEGALAADPAERPTLGELAAHAWFSSGVRPLSRAELRDELSRRAALVPGIKHVRSLLAARKIGGESPRGVEEDSYAS